MVRFHSRGGLGQRLPLFARHLLAQRRERAFEDLGGLEQVLTAPRRRLRRPRRLRAGRRGERRVDVVGGRRLKQADDLVDVGRVHVRERFPAAARHPFAADVVEKLAGHAVLYPFFTIVMNSADVLRHSAYRAARV